MPGGCRSRRHQRQHIAEPIRAHAPLQSLPRRQTVCRGLLPLIVSSSVMWPSRQSCIRSLSDDTITTLFTRLLGPARKRRPPHRRPGIARLHRPRPSLASCDAKSNWVLAHGVSLRGSLCTPAFRPPSRCQRRTPPPDACRFCSPINRSSIDANHALQSVGTPFDDTIIGIA